MNISYLKNKGFFHLLSANFLTQFLGFGTILLVAKFLSPTELGEIKIIQSYAAVFIVLAGFGFNSGILKFCSENRTDQERSYIFKHGIIHSLLTVLITLCLVVFLAFSGLITSTRNLSFWLVVYCLIIPFAVLTDNFMVFLQSQKQIKKMAGTQLWIKLQSFICIVAFTWIWRFKGFIYSTIIAYILGLIPLLKQVGLSFLKGKDNQIPKGFFKLSFYSVLANGVAIIGRYLDIFMLDHFIPNRSEIGYYSLATIFILAATQVTGTVQSISTPYFSEKASDEKWFRNKLIKTQFQMTILSIFVAVGIIVMASVIVPLIYGEVYKASLNYIFVLLLKYILFSSYAIIGVAILGLGMVHYSLIIVCFTTIINGFLSYYLLNNFGVVGVAWAQVITTFIGFILAIIFLQIVLKSYYRNKE
jgi:O-antigen/teichoic acid export membrane protein